jgi:hypothetical protein
MANLIEFTVAEGTEAVVTFEVDPGELPDDLVLASRDDASVAARAQVTLEKVLNDLKPSLERVVTVLKGLSPTEATLQFGLKVGGETGIIVAKGTAEANFTVTLAWKHD